MANNIIQLNSKFILALDDEFDIVTLVKQGLQKYGFNIFAFTDPLMALEDFKIKYNNCSLILSDIRMPGMNGYEFVKKAKEIDKQVKIVLMSAFEINDRVSQTIA